MPRWALNILSLLMLWVAAATVCVAADAAPEVQVVGLVTVSADVVRSRFDFGGRPADAAALDEALKQLMATGLFSDVRIDHRGRKLVVTVVENPIVGKVTIEGASGIDTKTVEAEVKLKPRDRFTETRMRADATRIRDLYRRRGRMATTVDGKATKKPDGGVDVAFVIKEGAVSKIEHIAFAGNHAVTERDLRDVISTSESGWFDILKAAAFYDPQRLDTDKQLIRQHYNNHGFPDARVTGVKADLNAQGTGYVITFDIEEGERFTFGLPSIDTKIDGVDGKALEARLKVKPEAAYSRDSIERSVVALNETLSEQGHPFTRVQAIPSEDSLGRRVNLVFRIEQAKPLYVERLDIVGNEQTKDFVIRRALGLAEGDPVNQYLLERARTRVKALGFFKSVDLKAEDGSAPDRTRITVTVVEDESGALSFGVGYSSSEGVVGDISWTERNLLGNGQYLRIKLSGSLTRLQADVGFTEPHLLGTNLQGGFDLFYKDTDYTTEASYKNTKVGGDLRLGVPITDQLSTSVNYTFVHSTIYGVGPAASLAIREAVPGFPANTSASYNTSSVGTGVAYDTRDNKKHPTSGVYVTMAQDFAGVGGDVQYIRAVVDAKGYYAVSDSVTLFGRATGGMINGWGGQDVRLLDLFYKGNDIVRGFAPAGIGPRDSASANQDALGGRMYSAATAETLFDLPGVPKDVGLTGQAFVDAGSLWGANRTAAALPSAVGTAASLRVSAGVGLAWDSPLGPLQVDYAVPLVKQAFDKTQPLSFGLAPF